MFQMNMDDTEKQSTQVRLLVYYTNLVPFNGNKCTRAHYLTCNNNFTFKQQKWNWMRNENLWNGPGKVVCERTWCLKLVVLWYQHAHVLHFSKSHQDSSQKKQADGKVQMKILRGTEHAGARFKSKHTLYASGIIVILDKGNILLFEQK